MTKKPKQTLLEHLMKSMDEENRWFGEQEAASLLSSMVEAVASLHERGIVHRDICLDKIAMRISKGDRVLLQIHGFEDAVFIPQQKKGP